MNPIFLPLGISLGKQVLDKLFAPKLKQPEQIFTKDFHKLLQYKSPLTEMPKMEKVALDGKFSSLSSLISKDLGLKEEDISKISITSAGKFEVQTKKGSIYTIPEGSKSEQFGKQMLFSSNIFQVTRDSISKES